MTGTQHQRPSSPTLASAGSIPTMHERSPRGRNRLGGCLCANLNMSLLSLPALLRRSTGHLLPGALLGAHPLLTVPIAASQRPSPGLCLASLDHPPTWPDCVLTWPDCVLTWPDCVPTWLDCPRTSSAAPVPARLPAYQLGFPTTWLDCAQTLAPNLLSLFVRLRKHKHET